MRMPDNLAGKLSWIGGKPVILIGRSSDHRIDPSISHFIQLESNTLSEKYSPMWLTLALAYVKWDPEVVKDRAAKPVE
jgi:hypothetical protein